MKRSTKKVIKLQEKDQQSRPGYIGHRITYVKCLECLIRVVNYCVM